MLLSTTCACRKEFLNYSAHMLLDLKFTTNLYPVRFYLNFAACTLQQIPLCRNLRTSRFQTMGKFDSTFSGLLAYLDYRNFNGRFTKRPKPPASTLEQYRERPNPCWLDYDGVTALEVFLLLPGLLAYYCINQGLFCSRFFQLF